MMSAQTIADRHNEDVRQRAKPDTAAGVGHNSQASTRFARDHLKAFVERIEKLEDEKKAIADDIRDVIAEAKGNGFDTKALRSLVKLRKQDPEKRAEEEAVLDTYKLAMGMI